MRNERSLLDRLDHEVPPASYSTQFDWNILLESVITNVQSMLNTRLGSVKGLETYGMPDFNDVVNQFPDAISRISYAIRDFLECYEPRLQQVYVHYLPDPDQPLFLRFSVEASLKHRGKTSKVAFDTVLTGAGQATVRV